MNHRKHKGCIVTMICLALLVAVGALCCKKSLTVRQSNPWNAETLGDIPTPIGFSRIEGDDARYAAYLRSLPLKPKGSRVQLYTGGDANLQFLSAAVIDMKLLSNYEQCADATMRLRAEYFYKRGLYGKICFTDVNGNKLRYQGGGSRKAFEKYMRNVYGVCSTFSLFSETTPRPILEVQPGDVLVYKAREGRKYGHAVLVADVAKNKAGKVAILCVEGNTPARELHVVRNQSDPQHNPWIILDGNESIINVSLFFFKANELRHY